MFEMILTENLYGGILELFKKFLLKNYCYMNPGAGFKLTKKSYEKIKELIKPYKKFFVLEGGYNPESIREGVDIFKKQLSF